MRKEKEIKIEEGRDAGKVFKITEMPAFQMEKWATRALSAIGKSKNGGVIAIASMEVTDLINAFMTADYEITSGLLEEMLECCSFIKDGTSIKLTSDVVDSIIEDWATITKLRWEAIQLNLGFFDKGDGSDIK